MKGRLLSLAVVAALVAAPLAGAAPGRPDRSFGEHGIVTAELGPHYEGTAYERVNVLGDGSVLAARDGQFRRYLPNGSLDSGFAPQPAPPLGLELERRAQLPSGKTLLLAPGPILSAKIFSATELNVTRLNADGSPDSSFGGDGVVHLRSESGLEGAAGVGIAGTAGEGALVATSTALLELSGSGALEKAYGDGGTVKVGGTVNAFHLLADGSALVAGNTNCCDASSDFFVARYTPGGAADAGFGDNGRATAGFGASEYVASALWGDDGSVLLGGSRMEARLPAPTSYCVGLPGCAVTPVIARFDPSGRLDPGFAQGGLLRLDALSGTSNRRIPVLGAGLIGVGALGARPGGGFVAGGSGGPAQTVAFLAALGPSGALDPGFGTGGIVTEREPTESSQRAQVLASGPGGRLYVGGSSDAGVGGGPGVFRFRPDGALDTAYGEAGFGAPRGGSGVSAMAIDRGGRATLLLGHLKLARLTPEGAVDESFGDEGSVEPTPGTLYSIAALPDGGLVAAGLFTPRHRRTDDLVAVRLRADGSVDKRFGDGGRARVRCRGEGGCVARLVAVDSAGRILLAGEGERRMILVRLLPDGEPDRSFGGDGVIFPPVGKGSRATAIAIRPDGFFVAGIAHRPDQNGQALLHYTSAGSLDRGFGRRGVAFTPLNHRINPTAILPNRDRIVVVTASERRQVLAYRLDGSPDPSFARGVKLTPRRQLPTLATLQRGKIVLGWTRPVTEEREQVALQRLNR